MTNQFEKHVPIEGYTHISTSVSKAKMMMDKVRSGELKPLFSSLRKETDKIGGYFPSDFVTIAARTGCGKTAKILHDVMDFCDANLNPTYVDNIIVLYDSYEMSDWRGVMRLISRQGEIEAKALLDYNKRLSEERVLALKLIADKFAHLPIYISTRPLSPAAWEESKKQIQGRFPKKRIINIYDHTRLAVKTTESKEEELISNLMFRGVYLKNNMDMFMFFISQMNRNIETAMSRDKLGTHTPISSDIFGSDAVFQCSDVVYALHRPGMYGVERFDNIPTGIDKNNPDKSDDLLVECVLKQREGWTGNLLLRHNLALNQITDYVIDQQLVIKDAPKNNYGTNTTSYKLPAADNGF